MICHQCKYPFPGKRTQRFCSHHCHNESMRGADTIDIHTLRTLVSVGIGKSEIARRMGVGRIRVRRAITMHGLERTWRKQRYSCA